jgi:hypothetical protein
MLYLLSGIYSCIYDRLLLLSLPLPLLLLLPIIIFK